MVIGLMCMRHNYFLVNKLYSAYEICSTSAYITRTCWPCYRWSTSSDAILKFLYSPK